MVPQAVKQRRVVRIYPEPVHRRGLQYVVCLFRKIIEY